MGAPAHCSLFCLFVFFPHKRHNSVTSQPLKWKTCSSCIVSSLSCLPHTQQQVGPEETNTLQWTPLLTILLYFAWKNCLQRSSCASTHPESLSMCGVSSLAQVLLAVPAAGGWLLFLQVVVKGPGLSSAPSHAPLSPHRALNLTVPSLHSSKSSPVRMENIIRWKKKKYIKSYQAERCHWKSLRHQSVEHNKSALRKYIHAVLVLCPLG